VTRIKDRGWCNRGAALGGFVPVAEESYQM